MRLSPCGIYAVLFRSDLHAGKPPSPVAGIRVVGSAQARNAVEWLVDLGGCGRVKASTYIEGIEALFNEALSQFRYGLNPRAASLAMPKQMDQGLPGPDRPHESIRIPNSFGGYNVVSANTIEAIVIPEKFAKEQAAAVDSAARVDFTTPP